MERSGDICTQLSLAKKAACQTENERLPEQISFATQESGKHAQGGCSGRAMIT